MHADGAEHQQDTCDYQHVRLDSPDGLQDQSTEGCSHDLREADGAVEQTEIASHVLPAQGIGEKGSASIAAQAAQIMKYDRKRRSWLWMKATDTKPAAPMSKLTT